MQPRDTKIGRLRIWHVSLAVLVTGIAIFASDARAGKHSDSVVGTSTAGATYGAMGTARAAKMPGTTTDDPSYVRCEVFGWNTPAPDGAVAGRCTFMDASNNQTQCYSSNKSIVAAMAAIGDSRVSITLAPNGTDTPDCASITVTNSSEYPPKAP